MTEIPVEVAGPSTLKLRRCAAWRGIRVLTWDGSILYGCRGYAVVRLDTCALGLGTSVEWKVVARFPPAWWRNLTSRSALTYRLMRDGFHALAIVHSETNGGAMVGAVPGAIVACTPENGEFHVTHRVHRGTRPLHIAAVPSGRIYWGEYFDNRERKEVHIYVSNDSGRTWRIAYTFPARCIRHIHNIIYDRWRNCLWILTGDDGAECKILRADCDLRSIEVVLSGNQQARAVAGVPTQDGFYFSTDTPSEQNHVYRLDYRIEGEGNVGPLGELANSSIFGCKVACKAGRGDGEALFFSTMVEPSAVNTSREVQIAGSSDGVNWQVVASWKKDNLPMRFFQYGNALLPDGENSTPYLAATTVAVESDDLVTTLWEVES
jgi:hypothetical protein